MKYLLYAIVAIIIFCTCKNTQEPSYLKDDIVSRYINQQDSLGAIDTSEKTYKVLKAYALGDYGFLEQLKKQEEITSKFIKSKQYWDSCLHQQDLPDIGADEAYRFNYSYVFSSRIHNVTVVEKGSSITLRYVEYEEASGKSLGYNILKDTTAQVTTEKWNALKAIIDEADFWGMKADDDAHILDGDSLNMWGYIRSYGNTAKYSAIHRVGISRFYISKAWSMVYELAGIKKI